MGAKIIYSDQQADIVTIEKTGRDEDILAVAGAGSGKTFTMQHRIIALINDGVPAQSILGLTFTRKAAAELRNRVARAVSDNAGREKPSEKPSENSAGRSAGRSAGSSGSSDRAANIDADLPFKQPQVDTYDAFFQKIVKKYGLLVGINSSAQPLSDAGRIQLAGDIVNANVDKVFAYFDSENADVGRVEDVTEKVLAISDACLSSVISKDCSSFAQAVAKIREEDARLKAQFERIISAGPQMWDDETEPVCAKEYSAIFGKEWTEICSKEDFEQLRKQRIEGAKKKGAKRSPILSGTPKHLKYVATELLLTLKRREILLDLAQMYDDEKKKRNLAEFSDFTVAAFRLAVNFPAIGRECRRSFSHVFLDEYQDTSTTQAKVLSMLFKPENEAENETGNEPENGGETGKIGETLHTAVTAVGDPFQSIYAWRGASPAAFGQFRDYFDYHKKTKSLTVTRRNSKLILDAANRLTEPLRTDPPIPSSANTDEEKPEKLSPLETAGEGMTAVFGCKSDEAQIEAVVQFAKKSVADYKKNNAEKKAAGVELPYKTPVAILFRSAKSMSDYRDALEEAGLSCHISGHESLIERPEIIDILSVLRTVADRSDTASLMRLAATVRFAVSDEALRLLVKAARESDAKYKFNILAQAGVLTEDELLQAGQTEKEAAEFAVRGRAKNETAAAVCAKIVAAHRDDPGVTLPVGVYVADILLDPQYKKTLEELKISRKDKHSLKRISKILCAVNETANRPISESVRCAAMQLDIDIDASAGSAIALSEAVLPKEPQNGSDPVQKIKIVNFKPHFSQSVDALCSHAQAYAEEIKDSATASLGGFVAWLDAKKQVEQGFSDVSGENVDVVLMTIHQSKGLEWESVAVVGVKKGSFPSNNGDSLAIADTDGNPAHYRCQAKTWLTDPSRVPPSVRADADLLPAFPSGRIKDLESFENIIDLENEAFGMMELPRELPWDVYRQACGKVRHCLPQSDEYGRRLLADERRLAYVAVTRAKKNLLVSYAGNPSCFVDELTKWYAQTFTNDISDGISDNEDRCKPDGKSGDNSCDKSGGSFEKKADVQVYDCAKDAKESVRKLLAKLRENEKNERSAAGSESAVNSESHADFDSGKDDEILEEIMPCGFFVGENAKEYADSIIIPAAKSEYRAVFCNDDTKEQRMWPRKIRADVEKALTFSVKAMNAYLQDAHSKNEVKPQCSDSADLSLKMPLLARAKKIVEAEKQADWAIAAGMMSPQSPESAEKLADKAVEAVADKVLRDSMLTVTGIQRSRGGIEAKRYIVRPVPPVPSVIADAGTRFHEWAEKYLKAPDYIENSDNLPIEKHFESDDDRLAIDNNLVSRKIFEAEVKAQEKQLNAQPADSAQLGESSEAAWREIEWKKRFISSPWAKRDLAAAESSIVVSVDLPVLQSNKAAGRAADKNHTVNRIIQGKIDAVFCGGFDPDDPLYISSGASSADASSAGASSAAGKISDSSASSVPSPGERYTIVDWKTGKAPKDVKSREEKLKQLDFYRFLFSCRYSVPLENMDAVLYYLSERQESDRVIAAQRKTREEIISELVRDMYEKPSGEAFGMPENDD